MENTDEKLNEINLSELAMDLIKNPEQSDKILNTLNDTEMLEDLYDALFSELGEYDKSYNLEHNNIILQIQAKISARIDQLKSYTLLKGLKHEQDDLKIKSEELSSELAEIENTNEIGE